MVRKIIAALSAFAVMLSLTVPAGAKEIEGSATGAPADAAVVAAEYEEVGSTLEADGELPSYYSSAAKNMTTPVRNQIYNTCWAYASTASFESLLLTQHQPSRHLSTMHMNYWGCLRPNGNGWQRSFRDAGYPFISLGYLTSFGAVTNSSFDEDHSLDDYYQLDGKLYPYYSASSVIYLKGTDRETIKTAIYNYGGVVGNFHYQSGTYLSGDQRSYYCDLPGLTVSQLNGHAVELVGWDDNYSADNFLSSHRPGENGAWLCKNSYGSGFGINGYFWISYEDMYLFDSRFGPSYAISEITRMTAVNKLQQNEEFCPYSDFDYIQQLRPSQTKMTYVNVLDFSDGYHNIDKIIFESASEGSSYTAYYIPVDASGVPVTDTDRWMLLAQGVIDHQGYTSADVYGFDAPAEKGAIGIQIEKNGDTGITIGVDEWITVGGRYIFKPDSQYGQSYLIGYTAEPMDVMEFYHTKLKDDIGGTLIIKALCSSDDKEGDVDRDGDFAVTDVTVSQRMLADMEELTDEQTRFADFDNDGEVDIVDCTKMQRSLAKLSI